MQQIVVYFPIYYFYIPTERENKAYGQKGQKLLTVQNIDCK